MSLGQLQVGRNRHFGSVFGTTIILIALPLLLKISTTTDINLTKTKAPRIAVVEGSLGQRAVTTESFASLGTVEGFATCELLLSKIKADPERYLLIVLDAVPHYLSRFNGPRCAAEIKAMGVTTPICGASLEMSTPGIATYKEAVVLCTFSKILNLDE